MVWFVNDESFWKKMWDFFYRGKARETNLQRLQRRVVDLLHFWVEGFYPVDFEDNEDLINSLQFFLEEQVKYWGVFVWP